MHNCKQIEPSDVVFETVLPGLIYVQNISIRNLAPVARRIRIEPPAAKGPFEVIFTPSKAIAPGLDVLAEIRFHLLGDDSEDFLEDESHMGIFRDKLLVRFDDDLSVEVPLTAHMPHPCVKPVTTPSIKNQHREGNGTADKHVFEPVGTCGMYALRLGEVSLGSTTTYTIILANAGPIAGSFHLDCESSNGNELSIEPSSGTIGANTDAYMAVISSLQKYDAAEQRSVDVLQRLRGSDSSYTLKLQLIFKANALSNGVHPNVMVLHADTVTACPTQGGPSSLYD